MPAWSGSNCKDQASRCMLAADCTNLGFGLPEPMTLWALAAPVEGARFRTFEVEATG
jgi:hypothetical protein